MILAVAFARMVASGMPENRAVRPWQLVALAVWVGVLTGFVEVAHEWVRQSFTGLASLKPPDFVWMAPASHVVFQLVPCAILAVVAAVTGLGPRVALFSCVLLAVWSQLLFYTDLHAAATFVASAGVASLVVRTRWAREGRFLSWSSRSWLWLVALVVAIGVGREVTRSVGESRATASNPAPAANAPNVLLVVLDTVRVDHLSCYGYGRETTPNIDLLAKSGIKFDRALATSPWTLPTHVTIFTGRYHYEIEADYLVPMGDEHATLAEVFSERGYATGGFVGNLAYCSAHNGLDRGFVHYEDYHVVADVLGCSTSLGWYLTDRLVGTPLVHLLRNGAERVTTGFLDWQSDVGDRPYFAFLNYFDAHQAYMPPRPFDQRFSPDNAVVSDYEWPDRAEHISEHVDAYDGCIAHIDDQIGRMLRELEARGAMENTVVIVTSDHGELFGEHKLQGHGNSLYLPLIHAPLVISHRGTLPQGVSIASWASLRDLPATILDLADATPSTPFPGDSLTRYWDAPPGAPPPTPSPLIAEVNQADWTPKNLLISHGPMKSLIENGLHYIYGPGFEEVFDLTTDPLEQDNLLLSVPERGEPFARALRKKLDGLVGAKRADGR